MKQKSLNYARALVDVVEKKEDVKELGGSFIQFLQKENDLDLIYEIIEALDIVWKQRFGVSHVEVATAYPLEQKLKKELVALAKGASINEIVDKELIGGARLRIDERIIDGTISQQLNQLKTTLTSN